MSNPPPEKPRLTQGDLVDGQVTALIDDADARGAIGGVDNVRVSGGVPGDVGTFRVVHAGKNATWARPHDLTTPSPDRVEAPCPVVARCGGCPWQMVDQARQHAVHDALLHAALAGVTDDATRWHPRVAPAHAVGYRTRGLVVLRHLQGALRHGFYEPRSNTLVPAETCVIHHPRVNAVLDSARRVLATTGVGTWRDAERGGVLRGLLYRVDPDVGHGLLTIIVGADNPAFDTRAGALLGIEGVSGVALVRNPAGGGAMLSGRVRYLKGARRQPLGFADDLTLLCGPTAFVQTHHAMAREMVAWVRRLAPERVARVVDAYAGIGVFGFALRDRAGDVVLIEQHEAAYADARANASRLPAATHVEARQGDAAALLGPTLARDPDAPTLVVLDPPRGGCHADVRAALGASRVTDALYASCNPTSLARDLADLAGHGFRVTDVVAFEMFPHTPHQEVLVRLSRATVEPAAT